MPMFRFVALLLLLVLPAAAVNADPNAAARREFQSAYAAVATTAPGIAVADSDALRNYPLYPYLQAARLQRRISDPAAAADIAAFLAANGDQPAARSLRRSWLMELALRKQWDAYLAAYREDLDDNQRAAEAERTRRIVQSTCN